jgi:acyl-CoA synthetase (AMP-forming)/AMP-acid ligase II
MFGDIENLGDLIIRNVRKYRDKEAVVSYGKRLSWLELNNRVNGLANALLDTGIKKGDRIATLMLNGNECFEISFAAAKIGAILVRINYRLSPKEIEYIISDSGSDTLIMDNNYIKILDYISSGALRNIISVGELNQGIVKYESLINSYDDKEPALSWKVGGDDIACIVYTSGTTGFPKGAIWTHKSIFFNVMNISYEMRIEPFTRILHTFPTFFSGGTMLIFQGAYIPLINHILNWDTELVLDTIEKERIQFLPLAPSMLIFMLDSRDIDKRDFSSLENILYAASPMPFDVLKRGIEVFRCRFMQFYGPTECGPSGTFLPSYDHIVEGREKELNRLKSAGREMVNVRVRVVDDNGRDMPPYENGEIIIKSPGNMSGYWNNPEETEKTVKDGFVYTGDIGFFDEDGYLYIMDRKKDMIISGGANIYPAEIERVLYSHPKVLDAAVIGVPDDRWGEAVKAIVVLKEGAKATEEEIIEFCKHNLASYKKPRSVEFVDSLPRTPSGKVLKRVLRDKYWRGRNRKI